MPLADANFGTDAALFWSAVGAFLVACVFWFKTMPSYPERPPDRRTKASSLRLAPCGDVGTAGLTITFVARVRSESKPGFCSAHSCISNFDNGHGYILQCADGMWSHSGGLQGACSNHGGER